MQQNRAREEANEIKKRKEKAEVDRKRFNQASEPGTSLYLKKKQVAAHGIRFETMGKESILLIPMRDEKGEIQALQEIYPTKRTFGEDKKPRDKNFTNAVKGLFHVIGTIVDGKEIRVSEGYATAASCYESTGKIIPHVVVFSASAYSTIIPIIRKLYPNSKILICADNNIRDNPKEENTGRAEAERAAKGVDRCRIVFPTFAQGKDRDGEGKRYADFNDLMIVEGKREVEKQIAISQIAASTIHEELKQLANTLLDKEEPCANFSAKDLPKRLCEYIESRCESTDAHPIMITASVLSSISGIIKKRLYIPQGEYFQTLYPNLWMLNLYKSGGFKSTAMESGASIARGISKDVRKEMKDLDIQMIGVNDQQKKELENKKLEKSLNDVILPNKITAEAFLEHLGQGHSGVILTGEFGAWLQNMEKNHNVDLKAIFTELYDVPPAYRYKTKTQGDHILENPCFSISGVSTLAWLKENLKANDVSSGFFARFLLFTPPDQDPNYIPPALPRFTQPTNPNAELMIKETLKHMDEGYEYKLAPSAKLFFESSHNSLYSMTKSCSEKCQVILDPYLKRWSPYLLKLAMIMRLFEDPTSKEISDSSIQSAMSILLPAIKSTARLFEGELGESDQQRKRRLIFEWIRNRIDKGKSPTWAALITSNILDGGSTMYEYHMKTLVEGGQVNEIQKTLKKEWLYVPANK